MAVNNVVDKLSHKMRARIAQKCRTHEPLPHDTLTAIIRLDRLTLAEFKVNSFAE